MLDISDPTKPTHTGAIFDDATTALDGGEGIVVVGNYAYVASSNDHGIEVLDISNPTTPTHTTAILDDATMALDGATNLAVFGAYLYVTSNGGLTEDRGVTVFDISDPAAPTYAGVFSDGSLPAMARPWGLAVVGNYAYVASLKNEGVQILEVPPVATAVAAGGSHTCALLADGRVQCWGYNNAGQLGNETKVDSTTPVTVIGVNTATAIAAGYFHTCARLKNGTVKCWGSNASGQLGNGSDIDSPKPVPVTDVSTATAVAGGYHHTCARLRNGTVKCWGAKGYEEGQLGNGSFTSSDTPVTVTGVSTATAVAAGDVHTCAPLANGTVQCWGSNAGGQLGNGSYVDSLTPVTVKPFAAPATTP